MLVLPRFPCLVLSVFDGLNLSFNEPIRLWVSRALSYVLKTPFFGELLVAVRVIPGDIGRNYDFWYSLFRYHALCKLDDHLSRGSFTWYLLDNGKLSRYSSPFNEKTSVPTSCHGLVGISCCSRVPLVCEFWLSWQISHFCTLTSISILMFGQYTLHLARSWHFSTPWWAWCISSMMSPLLTVG